MKELTPRLAAMAEEIKTGETVADVGTDHGYLPLYLRQRGISPSVIVTDVSRGSLKKAEENFAAAGLADAGGVSFRLGDGLSVINEGEAEAVVIAGMGGLLISRILQAEREKARSCKRLILQPRNNAGELRRYLLGNGFEIKKEKLVREGRFICGIIVCTPRRSEAADGAGGGRSTEEHTYPEEYAYPEALLSCDSPLKEEYLRGALKKEKRIEAAKAQSRSVSEDELAEQRRLVAHLERLVKKL